MNGSARAKPCAINEETHMVTPSPDTNGNTGLAWNRASRRREQYRKNRFYTSKLGGRIIAAFISISRKRVAGAIRRRRHAAIENRLADKRRV